MATFSEIEDLRDWMIDTAGAILAKIDVIDGEEDPAFLNAINERAQTAADWLVKLSGALNNMLMEKKRAEGDD